MADVVQITITHLRNAAEGCQEEKAGVARNDGVRGGSAVTEYDDAVRALTK
jgi:hypothetical protein